MDIIDSRHVRKTNTKQMIIIKTQRGRYEENNIG
jgi:hypothetical protein